MEYSAPYPSSVPHIILVPHQFSLDKMFYGCSMVVECFLLGIFAVFFILAAYFRCGNHKLLIDQSNNQAVKKDKQNIICEVIAKTMQVNAQSDSQMSSSCQSHPQDKNSLESELLAQVLRIYQRRLVYSVSFTIPWVVCISFFDVNILIVICGAIFIACILLFNMKRMLPQWKITLFLYFVPSLASIFPYIGGNHTLYQWTTVKDPLQLLK